MAKGARDLGRLGCDTGGYDQSDREADASRTEQNRPYSEPRRPSTRRSRRTIEITQPRMRSKTTAYAANTCQ